METLHLHNYRLTICDFLWKQYTSNSLCDVVINTSDGQQIQAHRIVLAAFSDHFCQQIEMQNMTSNVAMVINVDFNYDCMKALIDFMYNGKLDVPTAGNSQLFSAAVTLNISSVQTLLLESKQNNTGRRKSTRKSSRPSRLIYTTDHALASCMFLDDPKNLPVFKIKSEENDDGFNQLSLGDDNGDNDHYDMNSDNESGILGGSFRRSITEKDGKKKTANAKRRRRKRICARRIVKKSYKKPKRKTFKAISLASLSKDKYGCTSCSKKFPLQSLLKIHCARKHGKFGIENDLRRAILNRCVKFQQKTKLICRVSTSEKKVYRCSTSKCKKAFKHYSTLCFHIKKQHSMNVLLQRKLMHYLSIKKKFFHKEKQVLKGKGGKRKYAKIKRNVGDVQCTLCFSYLSSVRDLSNHMIKVHKMSNQEAVTLTGYPKYKKLGACLSCTLCWEVFSTAKSLKLHQKHVHKVKDAVPPCSECGKNFRSLYALKNHLRTVHRQRTTEIKGSLGAKVSCEIEGCSFSSPSIHKVNLHVAERHPGVVYKCGECRFMCHLKVMLDRHYITSHLHRDKYFKIKCQICDKTFVKRPHCMVHEYTKHGINHPSIKLHRCPFEDCGYVTINKAILRTHELKHSNEKKFPCQFCGTKLKTRTTYNKHIKKMHLGIRPHLCQVCGATFGEESELSAHIKNKHSTEKQFQCEHCPYATSSKSTFFTHLFMVHKVRANGDKRKEYSCPHCNYITVIKNRYRTHLNGHKNIREHVCSECGKQFITRSTLVSHVQWVHSGKVYSCNQCDYRTKTVQKLNEHVRVQHQLRGFKPYRCPYCDFTCATGGNCRKHVKQRHRELEVKYIRDDTLIEAARLARQVGNCAPFVGNEVPPNSSRSTVIGGDRGAGRGSTSRGGTNRGVTSSGAPRRHAASKGVINTSIANTGIPPSGFSSSSVNNSNSVSSSGITGSGMSAINSSGMPSSGMPSSSFPGPGVTSSGMTGSGFSGSSIISSCFTSGGMTGSGVLGSGIPGSSVPSSGHPGSGVPVSGVTGSGVPGSNVNPHNPHQPFHHFEHMPPMNFNMIWM